MYNPKIHHRRSIRLKGYDYSLAGLYFVTICTKNMDHLFGEIKNKEMILNDAGEMVKKSWSEIPQRFPNAALHEYIVMPNHIHGIVEITHAVAQNNVPRDVVETHVGATLAVAQNPNASSIQNASSPQNIGAGASPAPTATRTAIGGIIGAFKSLVANECLKKYKSQNEYMGKLWQRGYYEHIIRDEQSYKNIADYIINNPANWR